MTALPNVATVINEIMEGTWKGILDTQYQDFIASFLPLYSGPCVTVRIGTAGPEYTLSKAMLCKQSSYFAATFEGNFQEGRDQAVTLNEEDGVVTQRSFEMLIQWLYVGRVIFDKLSPTESITAIIEVVRLADMFQVGGLEIPMAEHIKTIILANPAPNQGILVGRDVNTNTYCLVGQHFTSACFLPDGHPVRKVLAIAAVEGYIRCNEHKFLAEIRGSPNFAVDLLLEVKETLKTVDSDEADLTFIDPFSGKKLLFVTENT